MTVYVTSDLHFHHTNIMKFHPITRPQYESVHDMNNWLIDQWNKVVTPQDTVYHLGDFSFSSNIDAIQNIIDRLNGNIIFIKGNHDNNLHKIVEVKDYLKIKYNGQDIIMFHYPITSWDKKSYGSIHLFGHLHGKLLVNGRSMDVGWDANFKILTLDECIERMIKIGVEKCSVHL